MTIRYLALPDDILFWYSMAGIVDIIDSDDYSSVLMIVFDTLTGKAWWYYCSWGNFGIGDRLTILLLMTISILPFYSNSLGNGNSSFGPDMWHSILFILMSIDDDGGNHSIPDDDDPFHSIPSWLFYSFDIRWWFHSIPFDDHSIHSIHLFPFDDVSLFPYSIFDIRSMLTIHLLSEEGGQPLMTDICLCQRILTINDEWLFWEEMTLVFNDSIVISIDYSFSMSNCPMIMVVILMILFVFSDDDVLFDIQYSVIDVFNDIHYYLMLLSIDMLYSMIFIWNWEVLCWYSNDDILMTNDRLFRIPVLFDEIIHSIHSFDDDLLLYSILFYSIDDDVDHSMTFDSDHSIRWFDSTFDGSHSMTLFDTTWWWWHSMIILHSNSIQQWWTIHSSFHCYSLMRGVLIHSVFILHSIQYSSFWEGIYWEVMMFWPLFPDCPVFLIFHSIFRWYLLWWLMILLSIQYCLINIDWRKWRIQLLFIQRGVIFVTWSIIILFNRWH